MPPFPSWTDQIPWRRWGTAGRAAGWVQRCASPGCRRRSCRRTSRREPDAHSSDRDSRHNNKPMDDEVAGAPSMPKNTLHAGPRERAILYRS